MIGLLMFYIMHMHWLWLYGALAFGLVVGCLTYRGRTTQRIDRLVRIMVGALGVSAGVAIAAWVRVRFVYVLEFGLTLFSTRAAASLGGSCAILPIPFRER